MSVKKNLCKAKTLFFRYIYLYAGLNISIKFVSCFNYFILKKQLRQYKKQGEKASVSFPAGRLFPCYEDKQQNAGVLNFHYFYQDLYVAQKIYQNNPNRHVDIGSSINGFIAHVASFREVEVYDIRPLDNPITNVKFKQVDIMNPDDDMKECTDSVSCLHALEHFGLGRYGDPVCYDGYLTGFCNIYKMLKTNGKLYFSVPLGRQRVEFHAHRVFSLKYLLELISPYYFINSFSYVDDNNEFYENVMISEKLIENNCNCRFGCAIFELTKK